MNFMNFGIRGKLMTLIVCSIMAFAGTIYYAISQINNISSQSEKLGTEVVPFSKVIGNVRARVHACMRFNWKIFLDAPGSKDRQEIITQLKSYREQFRKDVADIKAFSNTNPKTKELLQEFDVVAPKFLEILDYAVPIMETGNKQKDEELLKYMNENIVENSKRLTKIALELNDIATEMSEKTTQQSVDQAKAAFQNLLMFSLVMMLALAAVGLVFSTKISHHLNQITEAVSSASTQVSSASSQLSQSSEQLSSASQSQASSLEETSAALTEISSMADSNAKGAEVADSSVKEVFHISEETRQSMDELTNAMKSILESNERIEKLVKVIEEIGEKTEVIDEIVFKTQLLSFNASVEAERAGEHGRGFAVVAQEVGNLAQMSGKAALEISSIVKNSIKEANQIATENRNRVEAGGSLASDTKDKMGKVLQNLTAALENISKIVAACREQRQGISQISTSIENISKATQETAGTAEESSSASVELMGQAGSLMTLVSELQQLVSGQTQARKSDEKAAYPQAHSNEVLEFKPRKKTVAHHAGAVRSQANGTNSHSEADLGAWEKL